MKGSAAFSQGLLLLPGRLCRRILGVHLLLMTGMSLHFLARLDGLYQGPPPLYAAAAVTALLGGIVLQLFHSSALTGREAEAPAEGVDGGPGTALILRTGLHSTGAALAAAAGFPFIVLACRVQDISVTAALGAFIYLGLLFTGYGLFLETLGVFLRRAWFFNRVLTVVLILAHLLITPRLLPGASPVPFILGLEEHPVPDKEAVFQALAVPFFLFFLYAAALAGKHLWNRRLYR